MKMSDIFEMKLKTNEKLFLIYLYSKGCHKKVKAIETEEIAKVLSTTTVTVWRIKDSLEEKGLISISRAHAKAVQEYKIITKQNEN
ncbi:hypothetical protein [Bacillus mycoides]|uniref:hypothetical protein n=1 Tax=Bacillus mycoides TaxID=1405 RepID=UPI003D64D8E4